MKNLNNVLLIFILFILNGSLFSQKNPSCAEEVILTKVAYGGGDIPLCIFRKLKPNQEVVVNYRVITTKNGGPDHNYDMQIFKSVNNSNFEMAKTSQNGSSLASNAKYDSGYLAFDGKADENGNLDIQLMVRAVYGDQILGYFLYKGSFIRIELKL